MTLWNDAIPDDPGSHGKAPDPADLVPLARAFMPSRVLLTAVELGVLECLERDEASALQVAQALGTDARATAILLDALAAIGVVEKHAGNYSVRGEAISSLTENHPDSVVDALAHAAQLWGRWSCLTQVVEDGHPGPAQRSDSGRRSLALAMRMYARQAAPSAAPFIDGPDVRHMLDLGGGTGAFAVHFAGRFPRLHAVILDRDDQAVHLAEEDIAAANLQSRVSVRQADFQVDDIGEDYDLVFISSVVCTLSEEESRALLRKVSRALRPGGRLVVRDMMTDNSGTMTAEAALFSVSMLVTTFNGQVYPAARVKAWARAAGFENVHAIPTRPAQLVLGTKPVSCDRRLLPPAENPSP